MAIVDGHIRCNGCKELLPLASFPPSVIKRGNGKCSPCSGRTTTSRRQDPAARVRLNASARRWYARNRAKHLAKTARYYRANPDRAADRHLQRTYGISLAEYDRILAEQGGGCGLCGKRQGAEKMKLAVDHDHATGLVRGLLCHRCNRAIGALGDTVEGVRRALNYLERAQQPAPRALPGMRINLLRGVN